MCNQHFKHLLYLSLFV